MIQLNLNTTPAQYSFSQKTSSYKPHLTQHYKRYTAAAQLKTLLTLQIFQKICLWLVSDKTLALHHFYTPKNFIFKVVGKQMSIYYCKSPSENFFYRDRGSFYLVGGDWMIFSRLVTAFHLIKLSNFFNWNFWKFNYFPPFQYFHQ